MLREPQSSHQRRGFPCGRPSLLAPVSTQLRQTGHATSRGTQAPASHFTTAPEPLQGLPYVHERFEVEQAVPRLGAIAGHPGVEGGPAQVHFGGGTMQGPPGHDVHTQSVAAPCTQTSPSFAHTTLSGLAGSPLQPGPG